MLESRNFVIFLKFIWQHLSGNIYTNIFEKSCISETLRGQRSESGIFTKSKAVDITYDLSWKSISFTVFK